MKQAYDRLAARYGMIVLEGAGSPAEINLKAGDIVNLRMARHACAPCLLVGDIDRGGVFAALAGTMLLLEPEERRQVGGFLINKLRGDPALLGDGLEQLRERAYGVPTLGVIPYLDNVGIADEDSVPLGQRERADRRPVAGQLDVVIIHLPHVANFDEFDALEAEPGICLRYVQNAETLGSPTAILIPGTKVTLSDLGWLRASGLDRAILAAHGRGSHVVGLCGGYQMMGEELRDPMGVEGPVGGHARGLSLLPVSTQFMLQKLTHQSLLRLPDGEVISGYEIHTGETAARDGTARFGEIVERSGRTVSVLDGAMAEGGRVLGTYLHGLFGNDRFRHRWMRQLGWTGPLVSTSTMREQAYDRLADAVEAAVDWAAVELLIG